MDHNEEDLCFWLLDVRKLWPGSKIGDAASNALYFLSPEEKLKAGNFYFLKDAKLSLASALLKRLFILKNLHVPWTEVRFARSGDPKHGKPCYKSDDGGQPSMDFNVSHQAGLVVLIGSRVADVQVGVDVTCVDERNDRRSIAAEGFDEWVDMHAEVFSEADLQEMKRSVTSIAPHKSLDFQIRRFYAYWALKEAYVKLEGEAFLANWLKDVEFRNVKVPGPATSIGSGGHTRMDNIEVWFRSTRRADVEMTLEAFEENYLIATALKKPSATKCGPLPTLNVLEYERDVIPFAARFYEPGRT